MPLLLRDCREPPRSPWCSGTVSRLETLPGMGEPAKDTRSLRVEQAHLRWRRGSMAMRTHDGREPAPAGPLFGLSPEEAWRRFAFSGRQPCEVYAHPGPWVVAILLWPHACPTYVALWSWCGYCGGPTQDIGYVEDGGAQWLCHPCAEWAQILRPGVVKGAFVLMPRPESSAHGHLAPQ